MKIHAVELPPTQPQPTHRSRLMRRLMGVNGAAEKGRLRRAVSPLGGGVAAQFIWAVPVAALLWVAAAWAMGWLR